MEPTSENAYPLDSIKEGADEPVANDTCQVTYESNPGDMLHIPAEGKVFYKQHALKGQKLLAQGNALGCYVRKLVAL